MPDRRALAELVRLPAAISVPGDTLLGAAAAGVPLTLPGIVGRAAASSCLYLGGMALNDYADRDVDAQERPHRPIPSGRVEPTFALRLAQALTVAGVATAGLVGGRRALRVAVPLAASVWAYDLALKDTPAGPVAMAGCRALDVLLGASGGQLRHAVVPAAVVAGHTLSITLVSRHEAQGGSPDVARRSLWGTTAVTSAAATYAYRRLLAGAARRGADGPTGPVGSRRIAQVAASAVSGGLLAAYAAAMGRAGVQAAQNPSPARLQRLVGTGVMGLMPLEGALLASPRLRRTTTGAAVAALWPLARSLARRRAVT
jgi:UbiA prenyltransferase family